MEDGILTEDERHAIRTLASIYPKCRGICNPEGDPCELLGFNGECIAIHAYLVKVRID